jgi:asparagine synthase (glutamine-hydrolysing)
VCGIAGFLAPPGERAERGLIERMTATLRHRGPDALGYHVEGRIALGVARLRVIDLETGDQPIANENGSVHVVLNGEIYNFVALREELRGLGHRFATRSDTEVIAHAWEEYGEHGLEHLNGMFALALWDRRREQLLLARDRMGEKPLYYAEVDGWLVFGSELRAVLAHPAVGRELDLHAVSRYLAYDFVPDPHSMIRGVRKLAPAEALVASDGKVIRSRYWDLAFRPEPAVDEATWGERIRARLDEAVRLRLASDVPVGCFLSGGIDSTAVTTTAARLRSGIRTFSVGYAESPHDERRFARLVAERYGTRHEELVVSGSDALAVLPEVGALMDEPLADMSFVPLHLLARAAKRSVTVALSGDGGDELFAGYPTMAADWWHRGFARLPRPLRDALGAAARRLPGPADGLREFLRALDYPSDVRNQTLLGGWPPERAMPLFSPAARAGVLGFDAYRDIDAVLAGCESRDVRDRLIYRYCKLYLAGQNLANADRASMAASLELRAPLLDHTFVELTAKIPARLKFRGFRGLKRLFKQALADRLPREIATRGKQGFGVPLDVWLRGPLRSAARELLDVDRLARAGVFDPATVSRLLVEHQDGARSHARILWALLVFESWRTCYLGEGASV